MAHYHFTAKLVKRRDGRLATQVAAYKLGQAIKCDRTGRTFDYSTSSRVVANGIETPSGSPDWALDHQSLWNRVEARETRKDAQLLRDYELALPCELNTDAHVKMVRAFARSIVDEFGVVAGWGIHLPRDISDERNIVAFILLSTRALEGDAFDGKIREMSVRPSSINIISRHRKLWADIQNEELAKAGLSERVDHRSLKKQREDAIATGNADLANELDRAPGRKLDRQEFQAAQMRERRAGT